MDPMLTLMQTAALAVAGMCHALLGSVKVSLARELRIDEQRVGGLVSVFGFTLIPMVLAFGFLVDSIGKQAVLAGGFVLVIVSLGILSIAPRVGRSAGHVGDSSLGTDSDERRRRAGDWPYLTALLGVLVLGTGWSALVNVLNVTSPPAFVPASQLPARMAYAMNMGDFIFGMGAFLTPILVALLIPKLGLLRTFLVLATFAVVPLLLGLGVHWERLIPKPTQAPGILSDPIVWLCCLAFFCHVPVEAAVATWATTLMTDQGVREKPAAILLSAFWLTFTGSRLLTALTLPKGAGGVLVVTLAVLCIAVTIGIALSRKDWLTCALVLAAGLILGPIFPTLIAILLGHVEATQHGRVVGMFFSIGGVGWTVIPILIGAYAKRTSVQRAFLIAAGSAVLLTIFTSILLLKFGNLH